MKRFLMVLLPLSGVVLALWLFSGRETAPETAFVKAERQTLVSLIATNGRVEPSLRQAVYASAGGMVEKVHVRAGEPVTAGAPVVTLAAGETEAAVAAAESRVESARAALHSLARGGPASEVAEIEGSIAALRVDLEAARREAASLERLVEQKAATRAELDAAKDRQARVEAELAAQQKRKAALVEEGDLAVAKARLREAEDALALARRQANERVLRSEVGGTVYAVEVREGDYLPPGGLAAHVGRLDPVEVTVYVDEPDLGRIREGLEVAITWDARPGQTWEGRIERIPSRVAPLGSRQVGEVLVEARNPDSTLPAGANINVEIQAETVRDALALPKEALQRNGPATGVYVLEAGRLKWRPIRTGVATVTHVQILEGLADGDSVALPGGRTLTEGDAVTPLYR